MTTSFGEAIRNGSWRASVIPKGNDPLACVPGGNSLLVIYSVVAGSGGGDGALKGKNTKHQHRHEEQPGDFSISVWRISHGTKICRS